MTSEPSGPVGNGGWPGKFAAAISGLTHSVRTQSSFWVHLPIAIAVLSVAGWLRVDAWRWATLLIVISLVLSAELINTSIELIGQRHRPRLRDPAATGRGHDDHHAGTGDSAVDLWSTRRGRRR